MFVAALSQTWYTTTVSTDVVKERKHKHPMKTHEHQPRIEASDVARWFTFGGFWGFVFYLLSVAGMLIGHRRQPTSFNARTALVGMGIHVSIFVALTSLFSMLQSLVTGKSSTRTARERIAGGTLERSIITLGASSGTGSIIPFLMAAGSLRAAERITGEPAFPEADQISWPRAAGSTALLSSITALAVARIAAWVAQDSRTGMPDQ